MRRGLYDKYRYLSGYWNQSGRRHLYRRCRTGEDRQVKLYKKIYGYPRISQYGQSIRKNQDNGRIAAERRGKDHNYDRAKIYSSGSSSDQYEERSEL